MDYPFVSVIVPNFNHAEYLHERFDSIFSQTYTRYEVIILDDHSTDGSMGIIAEYAKNPKVSHVVRNETNGGSPFLQWNRGIALAKGDLIWIAESDDYCDKDMLRRLVEAYVSHDCVLAFCRSMYVDLAGNKRSVVQRMFKKDSHWQGTTFVRRYLSVGNRIYNASSVVFSKDAARHAGAAYMEFHECGDWVFWTDIAIQGNVAVVAEPLNFFRRGDDTCTSKSTLCGNTDKEDFKVLAYMREKGLMPFFSWVIKCKRMAYHICYQKGRFVNEDNREDVIKALDLPRPFYVLAHCSHLFHAIFK